MYGKPTASRGLKTRLSDQADMDCISQVEMLDYRRSVGRIMVHVMANANLRGAYVTATVVRKRLQ